MGEEETSRERDHLLQDLRWDQRARWNSSQRATVAFYVQQHPSLASDAESMLELIYNEILLREQDGECAQLADYVSQYPELEEGLRDLFDVHQEFTPFRTDPLHEGAEVVIQDRFSLIEPLGEGGMGIVWKARQLRLNRIVALKFINSGRFASEKEITGFQAEARTAASLKHESIVSAFDMGEHKGYYYFAMEYVDGQTLDELVEKEPMPPAKAAEYVRIAAEATQYAYANGVMHGDLKPSNIIIDGEGRLRLLDFGLSKRTDERNPHAHEEVSGSPAYMAPEQFDRVCGEVGPAADVYALGAVLYQLLTGRPPFVAESLEEIRRLVERHELSAPRVFNVHIPRDLESICLKSLAQIPHDRYAEAGELAEDLRRFLAGEPVRARPISPPTRAVKWARRKWAKHRWEVVVLPSSVAVLSLVILSVVVGHDILRTNDLPPVATNSPETSPNDHAAAKPVLVEIPELSPVWSRPISAGQTATVSFSPRDQRILVRGSDGSLGLWDVADATGPNLLPESAVREASVKLAGFSPDGTRIVWVGNDGAAWLWNVENREEPRRMKSSDSATHAPLCLAFAPEGDWFAVGLADGTIEVRNMQDPSVLTSIPAHTGGVLALDFPDASQIVSAGEDGIARLSDWSGEGKTSLVRCQHGGKRVPTVACIPGDRTFVTGDEDGWVRLWDREGNEKKRVPAHAGAVGFLAALPRANHESFLLSAGAEDGSARIWVADQLGVIDHLQWSRGPFCAFAVSPDGEKIVTGEKDGWATVWNRDGGRVAMLHPKGTAAIRSLAFSGDSRRVGTGGVDGTAAVYDLP